MEAEDQAQIELWRVRLASLLNKQDRGGSQEDRRELSALAMEMEAAGLLAYDPSRAVLAAVAARELPPCMLDWLAAKKAIHEHV